MPTRVPFPPPGFDDLSVDDKIDYLEVLWNRVAATPETLAVPEWHCEVISKRLRNLESDTSAGDSWKGVQSASRTAKD